MPMGYRILGSVGRALIAAGVVTLLFAAFQLWGTNIEESRRQGELAGSLARSTGVDLAAGASDEEQADALATNLQLKSSADESVPDVAIGEGLGVIEIPKIGVKKIMVEGVNKDDLRKGPGHYPGTPLPGQPGNAGIAGHRTTYGAPFNRIDELVPGDQVLVFTPQGKFTYEVMAPPRGDWQPIESGAGWFSVRPKDSQVLAPTTENRLTLTACHPKLSAAQRIIVVAKLVDTPAATTSTSSTSTTTQVSDAPPDDTDAVIETPSAAEASAADFVDGLSGDDGALVPAIAWGVGALAVWLVAWLVRRRLSRDDAAPVAWRRRFWVWLVFAVPFAVPLWFCFFYVDRYLPSL